MRSLEPDLVVQAPSRINLINPLDAVEGDYWMPSVAINGVNDPLSVFLYIKSLDSASRVKQLGITETLEIETLHQEEFPRDIKGLKSGFKSHFKLVYASIYRFIKTSSFFQKQVFNKNFEIGVLSTIPQQSGLGGSTAIIVAVLYGLALYFNLYNNITYLEEGEFPLNKDIIAEMATKVEDEDLGITAGYADRYVISRGGLSFVSYYGKLNHKPIFGEPLAVYDRIGKTYDLTDIPAIVCYSGVTRESGQVHAKLRDLYLQKKPEILEGYQQLAELSWISRFALMTQDWQKLGEYFNENTKIMNRIMNIAGFEYGIGLPNNILIKLIEDHPDVYAVKLTGAGGGGSVFALVNPENVEEVLLEWKKRLSNLINGGQDQFKSKFPLYPPEIRYQMKKAAFYIIKIDEEGVKKLFQRKNSV